MSVRYLSVHIAVPGRGVEPLQGIDRLTRSLFSFVFRGDKARPTADPHSARGSIKRIIRPSLIFNLILSQERTKVKREVFVSEKLLRKLLPILSSATFRIFSGHRCILNLPYVLRIRVLLCRSPSHQPST